ncbi:MAG: DUF5106 domain-containing protein [Tannerella sp.]|jgi:hypothetical protein|nr:DUF5106 domain-containing protein [Tannerella sp.]
MSKKKHLTPVLCGLLSIVMIAGCTSKPQKPATKKTFKTADVPSIYADPQARAEYLAMHYWDFFDFTDTAFVGSSADVTEQAIVNYLSVIPYASYAVASNGLKQTMNLSEKNPAIYAFFQTQMEHYLFDIGSNMRNDEFYIPVLEQIIASRSINIERKTRPAAILEEVKKNRPGTEAANIHYNTVSGAKGSLHNIPSDFTIVMFHNLDCGNCKEIIKRIDASTVIKTLQGQKRVTVLGIYPGTDEEGWKKHEKEMPPSWISGFDPNHEISEKGTYILRVVPTLYLIDKKHSVIIKDAAFDYVEYYLNSILNPAGTPQPGAGR